MRAIGCHGVSSAGAGSEGFACGWGSDVVGSVKGFGSLVQARRFVPVDGLRPR